MARVAERVAVKKMRKTVELRNALKSRKVTCLRFDDLHLLVIDCSVAVALQVHWITSSGAGVSQYSVYRRHWRDTVGINETMFLGLLTDSASVCSGGWRQQPLPDFPGEKAWFFLFQMEDAFDDRWRCIRLISQQSTGTDEKYLTHIFFKRR